MAVLPEISKEKTKGKLSKIYKWFIDNKIYFDLIGLVGISILGYGLYLYKPFMSYAIVGLILLVLAVLGARKA